MDLALYSNAIVLDGFLELNERLFGLSMSLLVRLPAQSQLSGFQRLYPWGWT